MRVERIVVQAFGRLRELDTGPDPLGDLVVVLGPNEAGKTTLFHFLSTALYGFSPASREAHPYAPWGGAEPSGFALLRLADGSSLEVHRRLLSTPSGALVRAGRTEELRNRPLPAAEHVPAAVFRQIYAITLAELGGLEGESWERIQDRLVAGLGATDLRPVRLVADELEEEAGALWRPTRRGHQKLRELRERQRELEARRRDVVEADRTLRERVRELERTRGELERARAEREAVEVYVERYHALRPLRDALERARTLLREAGPPEELAALPPDPAAHLADLEQRAAEQNARVAELAHDAEVPRRRREALRPSDLKLLERKIEVERVTARVGAGAWMRARTGQLDHELREIAARVEGEAAELFDVPWPRVDADRVRALPAAQLRTRARDLDEARARTAAQREAARQLADAAADRPAAGALAGRGAALAVALVGLALLAASLATGRRSLALVGAVVLGAGAVLTLSALRRGAPAPAPGADSGPDERREAEALRALAEPLAGLPVRAVLLERAPAQIVAGVERIQQLLREREAREAEAARLRREATELAEEITRLSAACAIEVPADPVAAAHLLAAGIAEASRRQATVERAEEELARLERAHARERETLERLRSEAAALSALVAGYGDGDRALGEQRLRARREAAAQAARILAELERAHPDLHALRDRIRQAEDAGEDWVVDEEALARRRVRLPDLARRVENLARTEAAIEQEIRHLSAGETLDRIDGELERLDQEIRALERERDRRHVLARLLREADRRFRDEHQPELVRRAGEHLATITGGRYSRVLLADGTGEPSFRVRGDDAAAPIPLGEPLSTGTREQVYLALRLAAVDQLDREGERLPLFLDETLVNWDPERLGRGLDLLAAIARERQLFVFTCHPEAAERLAERGARIVRVDRPR